MKEQPMRAYATISGQRCEVEPLSRRGLGHYERINSPVAQVLAPDGYEFSGGESALCIHTAADLDSIERTESLVPSDQLGPQS